MGFTVGLVKDLPRGIINDTLKLVLDPLGSLLELMDALDQNNPNNYVHQLERSWQSGDTFSRSRIVGNVTGQVALAFTPEIVKKFAKIPTELGEARAAEIKPGAADIAEEAGTVARETEKVKAISDFGKYSTKIDSKVTVVNKAVLPESLAKTFTDGQYRTVITNEDIIVYRVFGYNAKSNGTFATTTSTNSSIQVKINSAILPEWKNSLQYEAEIIVPKGTTLNIGKVAEQFTVSGTRLPGGADQILLPVGWDDLNWIKNIREISVGGK